MQSTRDLMANHLAFLASHRGKVTRTNDAILVESDRPEFTYAIPETSADLDRLCAAFQSVHVAPWSGSKETELKQRGFTSKGALTYMTLGKDSCRWTTNEQIAVLRVGTKKEMDLFSEIQSRGFSASQSDHENWHPWLREANHRNLTNSDQIFYVGSMDGRAVGTVLLVFQGSTAGIYAVATLPDFRKRGVAATIMAEALSDAKKRGASTITLQVILGSYAEKFYEKLGFQKEYVNSIFSVQKTQV
jgi:ribosomal protein S18 acetylase RimI-like enzyme